MKYKDLIQFDPIESVITLTEADNQQKAADLVKTFVVSQSMEINLNEIIIPNLQFETPRDQKGIFVVGNYGTGKSHLMAFISALAENKQLGWDIRRNLTKINYRIHTNAIKTNLIPPELSKEQIHLVYATEVDILNMALFGMTAKQWRDSNPELKGNIRDYANVSQLVCLANLETLNAHFINEGLEQSQRLLKLNQTAIVQMKLLTMDTSIKKLERDK